MVPQPFRLIGPGTARFLGIAALALLGSASCRSVPLLAPSGAALTLIPAANEVPPNGSISIIATLIEGTTTTTQTGTTTTTGGGQPVPDGTEVTFTTTVGVIQPSTAKTKNGQVTVQLSANGQSGQATITAYSGAASKTATVAVGAAAAARIVVTANPQSLPATGGTSNIVASVQDVTGVGLAGISVGFSTTAGTLSQPTVVTDANGNAATTLSTVQAAVVTAAAAGAVATGSTTSANLSSTVSITLNPRTSVSLMAVTTNPTVSTATSIGVTIASSTPGVTPIVTSMHVDWGDGSSGSFGTLLSSVTHVFGSAQVFTVTVSVTDSTGTSSSGALQLAVIPLTATGTGPSGTITHGVPAAFSITLSNAAAEIDHYEWNWGPGEGPVQDTSSGSNTHAFSTIGANTVTVTIVPVVGPSITVLIPVSVS